MKVIIPSKGRADTISSHKLFDDVKNIDLKIILHNEEEKKRYMESNPFIDEKCLIVTNQPFCISNQRQWIFDNLIEEGEWFLTLDDNVKGFTALSEEYYNQENIEVNEDKKWRDIFRTDCNTERFLKICNDMIEECNKRNIWYAGFATVENYFFRGKKYREVGYVISKVALIRKGKVNYDLNITATDDYAFTAENLLEYGKVLINNYVKPTAGHYEKGGIGTYEERVKKKIVDIKYLMKKYPGLFRYKKKSGCHPEAEVQIVFTNSEQVNQWREKMRSGKHAYW